jgi:hypothetical protein
VVSARKSKIAKEAEVRQRWNQLERARAHLTMLQAIAAASPAAHRFRSITVRSAACRCSATAVIFGAFSIVVQEAAETLKASAAQVLFDTTPKHSNSNKSLRQRSHSTRRCSWASGDSALRE